MFCYLVRHGKDDDTVRGGWSMSGLTAEGVRQVDALVRHIKENQSALSIHRMISSDLPRAIETATPIAAALGLQVELMPEFRETNNGVFAGMPHHIADAKYPGLYYSTLEWDEPYPDGESPSAFYHRIKTAWGQLTDTVAGDDRNIMLVTHGGVMSVIYSLISGTPYSNKVKMERIPHATAIPLRYERGVWEKAQHAGGQPLAGVGIMRD